MKKLLPLLFLISTLTFGAYQIIPEQLSIGTTKPVASASLQLSGTTRGFVPNKMTTTQRNAIATPVSGMIIYNTTLDELQIYDGAVWGSAGGSGGIDNWLTATAYAVDQVVIESNKIYQCEIAHTSGTFATDLAAVRWVELSAQVAVNLTGPITSIGAATSVASQTGTGSTFVMNTSPTLVTPVIGAATGTSLSVSGQLTSTVSTGTAPLVVSSTTQVSNLYASRAALADTVTTNANLTGHITSTGNATLLGSFSSSNLLTALSDETGTGSAVFSTTPTLVTPILGVASGTSLVLGGTIDANAVLDVQSTTKASKANPRMTTAQKLAIPTPTTGMQVYDTTLNAPSYYDGTSWQNGLGTITVDTDWVAYTPTFQGFTGSATDCFWRRGGTDVFIKCKFTAASLTASEVRISLPTGLTTTAFSSIRAAGYMLWNTNQAVNSGWILSEPSTTYVTYGYTVSSGQVPLTKKVGTDLVAGTFSFETGGIPIVGWLSNAATYSGASANIDPTFYTPTITGCGAAVDDGTTYEIVGKNMRIRGTGVCTTVSGTAFSISMPSTYSIDATKQTTTNVATNVLGQMWRLRSAGSFATAGDGPFPIFSDTGTSSTLVYATASMASGTAFDKDATSTFFGSGERFRFDFIVPLSGRSNVSQVVANVTGYNSTIGVTNPKIFSAQITTTSGAVANQYGSNITSCTAANPTVCTLNGLTVEPNCTAVISGNTLASVSVSSSSSTSITITSTTASTGIALASQVVKLFCQGQ